MKAWNEDQLKAWYSHANQNYDPALSACWVWQHWTGTLSKRWLSCDWDVRARWGSILTWAGLFTLKFPVVRQLMAIKINNALQPTQTSCGSPIKLHSILSYGWRNFNLPLATNRSCDSPFNKRNETDAVLQGKSASSCLCDRYIIPVFSKLG